MTIELLKENSLREVKMGTIGTSTDKSIKLTSNLIDTLALKLIESSVGIRVYELPIDGVLHATEPIRLNTGITIEQYAENGLTDVDYLNISDILIKHFKKKFRNDVAQLYTICLFKPSIRPEVPMAPTLFVEVRYMLQI